jgi:prepilin-type N-terminal cleavage/methylation domain-containing protein
VTRRHGFTLIELILALVLTALVIGIAVRLQGVVSPVPALMRAVQDSSDRRINARLLLTTLVRTVDIGSQTPFTGGATHVSFSSRQLHVTGVVGSARVELALVAHAIVARIDSALVPVVPCVDALDFQYLLAAPTGARWVTTFGPSPTPPRAMRMRWRTRPDCGGATDSLLLRLPEAG